MVQICHRCQRANPHDATYCHSDGFCLKNHGGGAVDVGAIPFHDAFVFPSGNACRNFKELAQACQTDMKSAVEMLRTGYLEGFFVAQGRADLAAAARAAGRAVDAELGFDEFLGRLPASGLTPARLAVAPAVIDLGTMRPGEDRQFELKLQNKGTRLVYGSAVCDADWLALGDGPALQNKLFQFTARAALTVRVLGRQLRARETPLEAQIQMESSGGKMSVTVRATVPVKPFPEGVLTGALSPRQAAYKAKEAPAEAAPLLERGAVARWYQANGWTYPVRGRTASGIAAVQQFLEALGLASPPVVEVSEDGVWLRGRPGEKVEYSLAVITQENRVVWAFGKSNQPWLRVGEPVFRGRSAFLPLIVPAVPGNNDETLNALVSITANGGQQFEVPVMLAVGPPPVQVPLPALASPRRAASPVAVAPVPRSPAVVEKAPAPPPAAAKRVFPTPPASKAPVERRRGRRLIPMLTPAVLLLAIAGAAALRDYLAPARGAAALRDEVVDSVPRIEIRFHDEKKNDELEKLWLTDAQPTMRFGVVMLRKGVEVGQGANVKRLTFDPWGRTNNTCLLFDDTDARVFGGSQGSWKERAAKSWKDEQGQDHEGVRSVWVCEDKAITVTQFVELVRGEQSRLLDTCRVCYRIENTDNRLDREVGIRFLLDSFIGGNDGVPFTIPGESDLCDTMKILPDQAKDRTVPDFVQALEKPDLAHPGTIAHLRLKLDGLESPDRVTIGAWPNEKLRVLDRQAAGPGTLWDVPLLPLKSLELNDSAIAIYWKKVPLKPGGKREIGFEYGLGSLLASQSGRLAATIDGAFRPDGELTVVAYINRSAEDSADQSVTLGLPESFKLLEGDKTQPVPALSKNARSGNVPVTWKVRAGPTGAYDLTVTSSSGLSQKLRVEIRKSIY
jgi:hypothetical protein